MKEYYTVQRLTDNSITLLHARNRDEANAWAALNCGLAISKVDGPVTIDYIAHAKGLGVPIVEVPSTVLVQLKSFFSSLG